MSTKRAPWNNSIPNPKLPHTGSLHEERNGGWNAMHSGEGSFARAKWTHKKGNSLHNFLLIRPDCSNFTKSEILRYGKVNVHYFWESAAAVCWHNSYQLRWKMQPLQLEEEMKKITEMLNSKNSTGYIMNAVFLRANNDEQSTPKRVSKRKIMNIDHTYFDGDEIEYPELKIGGNMNFSDSEEDDDE